MARLFQVSFLLINTFVCSSAATSSFDNIKNIKENIEIARPLESMPRDFTQSLNRYIKHTISICLEDSQLVSHETTIHKKELRSLLNNYKRQPIASLSSHLQAIHKNLMKDQNNHQIDIDEQICSALLLWCIDILIIEINEQSLRTLDEINNLILYWKYQQEHPIYHFFHKSPIKWFKGKSQKSEISLNLRILKSKQKELYTFLGSLTEHMHDFTRRGLNFKDCYQWIEELFILISPFMENSFIKNSNSTFDSIATYLDICINNTPNLKRKNLNQLSVKKPTYFVRNWIGYTGMAIGIISLIQYHKNNPTLFPLLINTGQESIINIWQQLSAPPKNIYSKFKRIFNDKKEDITDPNDTFDALLNELTKVARGIEADISDEINKGNTHLYKDAHKVAQEIIETVINGGYSFNNDFVKKALDEKKLSAEKFLGKECLQHALVITATKTEPIKEDGKIINETELKEYKEAFDVICICMQDVARQISNSKASLLVNGNLWLKTKEAEGLLRLVNEFLDPLKNYTIIIDQKILRLFQLIGLLTEKLGRHAQANELTFMFSTLIPLGVIGSITRVLYKYGTQYDYSPLRIALADINSLLIESDQLNNCDYGKLLYLVYKLHSKAIRVEDSMIPEFLEDIAKLESKRYSATTKRDLIQNMFNKYTFLGRIAVQR